MSSKSEEKVINLMDLRPTKLLKNRGNPKTVFTACQNKLIKCKFYKGKSSPHINIGSI